MKLNASLFLSTSLASLLFALSSNVHAQPPLPAPSATSPQSQAAPAAPNASAASPNVAVSAPAAVETDRGARGESCRARSDCQTGLACIANVCRHSDEGKTCGARSDCGAPLACIDRTCVAEGERPLTAFTSDTSTSVPEPEAPITRPATISLDQTFFTRSSPDKNGNTGFAYYAFSTILGFDYRLKHLQIEAQLPLAYAIESYDGDNTTAFSLGNPSAGIYYVRDVSTLRLQAGGLIALPLASDDQTAALAQVGAESSRGFDRLWLWTPKTGTIAPAFRIGSTEQRVFQHHGEIVIAPLFGKGPTQIILQASEDLGAHVSIFRAGARLELVHDISASKGQPQLSILPYAGVEGEPGFVDLGLLVNITEPAGFSFDEGKYWGLRIRAGARF